MGRPKATLPWGDDETFVSVELRVMHSAGLSPLVVVCGEHARETQAVLPQGVPINILENAAPNRGQLSSLKIALRWLRHDSDAVGALVALVDHPAISSRTVLSLLKHVRPDRIVIPQHRGRRGHPVIFGRDLFPDLLRAPYSEGARAVVRQDPARIVEVGVEDPGVVLDIDTPQELAEARTKTGNPRRA